MIHLTDLYLPSQILALLHLKSIEGWAKNGVRGNSFFAMIVARLVAMLSILPSSYLLNAGSHYSQDPFLEIKRLPGQANYRLYELPSWLNLYLLLLKTDAAKVPPSRFQLREGSIFSTSSSRDSHITRKDRDVAYHAKLKEKVSWSLHHCLRRLLYFPGVCK